MVTTIVFSIHLWAAEVSELVTVVASGIGKTEDAALKQAFSNAVTQVVGTIVDAETMVQNDKIISEQILTYSNAIVTKYAPVGKPVTAGGFVAVVANLMRCKKRCVRDQNRQSSTKSEKDDKAKKP